MKAQDALKQWADEGGRKLGWICAQIPADRATVWRWMQGKTIPHPMARNRLADMTGNETLRDAANWGGADVS